VRTPSRRRATADSRAMDMSSLAGTSAHGTGFTGCRVAGTPATGDGWRGEQAKVSHGVHILCMETDPLCKDSHLGRPASSMASAVASSSLVTNTRRPSSPMSITGSTPRSPTMRSEGAALPSSVLTVATAFAISLDVVTYWKVL